jgi:hypothetical protein
MTRALGVVVVVGLVGAACRSPQAAPVVVEPPLLAVVEPDPEAQPAASEPELNRYTEALDRGDRLLGEVALVEALAAFEQAAELRPDELLPRSGVAVSLLELGRLDEAEAALTELHATALAVGDKDLAWVIENNLGELRQRREPANTGPCVASLQKSRTKLTKHSTYLAAWDSVATGMIVEYIEASPGDEDEAREWLCGDCVEGEAQVFEVGETETLAELHLAMPRSTGVMLLAELGSIMGGRCTPANVDVELDLEIDTGLLHVAIYETENWEDDTPFPIWDPARTHVSACYVESGRRRDLWIDVARGRVVAEATREDPSEADPADSITLEREGDALHLRGCGADQRLRL